MSRRILRGFNGTNDTPALGIGRHSAPTRGGVSTVVEYADNDAEISIEHLIGKKGMRSFTVKVH